MAPFLSVCVMTYNRAGTLREALDSILPQVARHPEIEVLVSDNASTDNTEEVMREYCGRHAQIRYSRNAVNVGFDGNVVACIDKAAGEYVAFFSDDDIATPDMLPRLLADLVEVRPIAAYTNHAAFFHDDPAQVSAPTQPVLKRVFTDAIEYFLYCGLGFISSLVLKTSEARKFTSKLVPNRGTAQVDIAARVVLSSKGPFLFDGTITVLGRYAYDSGYDPLRYGAMNLTQAHIDLFNEGLLRQQDLDWHNRKTIRHFLPRLIINNRLKAKNIVSASELRAFYGRDPLFYLYAYPLLLVPAPLLRMIFLPIRSVMRERRKRLLKRGKMRSTFQHSAPPQ